MANLDSALKRASGINPGCPWRGSYPPPDGTLDDERAGIAFMYAGIGVEAETPAPSEGARGGGFYWFENKRARKKLDTSVKDELRRVWAELDDAPREIRQAAAEAVIIAQKRAQDRPETLPSQVRFPKFSDVNWAQVLQVVSIELLRELAARAAREEEEDDEDLLLLH